MRHLIQTSNLMVPNFTPSAFHVFVFVLPADECGFFAVISSFPTACWKGAGRVKAKMTHLGLHSTRAFSLFHWSTSHNMPQIFPLSTQECPFHFQTPSASYNNNCCTSNKYILFLKSTNCTFLRFPPFFQSAVYTPLRMAFTDCGYKMNNNNLL